MRPLEDESRRIIAEGDAADGPSPELQQQIWEALAPRLSQPLPPAAAAASEALAATWKTGLLAGLGGKLVIGLATLGLLSLVGIGLYANARVPTASTPSPAAALQTPPISPVPAEPQEQAAAPSRRPEPSHLSEETRLVAAAQRALNAAAPDQALPLLEQHRRRFPRGELAQERDAAHALALCAAGRRAEAHAAVQHFLREWPHSPLTARVRSACR